MRIPLGTSLQSRDGTLAKDAKVMNAIVESMGTDPSGAPILRVRKRPGTADLGLVSAGAAQLLYNWNGIKAILGDVLNSGTISTIISGPTQTNLTPTNAGLQFSAQETGPSVATPRLMIKNRTQAWTVKRDGSVTAVTYGGNLGGATYNVTSITRVGTVATVVLPTTPDFNIGDSVTIAGATPIAYNGAQAVTGVTAGSFTPARPVPITITSVGALATATTVGAAAHGLTTATAYTIAGANIAEYNGSKTITVTSSTTFTFAITAANAITSPATGSLFYSSNGRAATATWNGVAGGTVSVTLVGHGLSTGAIVTMGPYSSGNNPLESRSITVTGADTFTATISPAYPYGAFTNAPFSVYLAPPQEYSSSAHKAVSSITSDGVTITVNTTAAHGIGGIGWTFTVYGADQTYYNVSAQVVTVSGGSQFTFSPFTLRPTGTITATDPAVTVQATFTFTIGGSPATPATGTITAAIVNGGTVPGIPYINGYFCVMDVNGVVWNSNQDDPTTWGALAFFTAQNEPGEGRALTKSINYLIALKQWTAEFFYDAKNPTGTPFSPVDPGFVRVGCASGDSLAEVDGLPTWVSQTKGQPGRSVHVLQGLTPTKISTPDVERILNEDDLATVYAYGLKEDGHALYVLTLVTSALTLVFDFASKIWEQWTSLTLGAAKSVDGIALDGDIATLNVSNHGLSDGDPIKISGAVQQEFNGIFPAVIVDANYFTIQVSGSPTTPTTLPSVYATWNPADKGSGVTLSGGNLTAACTGFNTMVRGTIGKSSGKWYWEVTVVAADGFGPVVGIATAAASVNNFLGSDASGFGYYGGTGNKYTAGSPNAYGATLANGDVVGIALDLDAGTLTFYKNHVSQGVAFTGLVGTFYPAVSGAQQGVSVQQVTANFGATSLAVPTGYDHSGMYITTISATPYTESYFKLTKAASYAGNTYLLHESSGHLYQASADLHQDAGLPINTFARTVRLDGGSLAKKKMPRIRIVADSADDAALVRWSDDDCQTFSGFRRVDLSSDQPETRKCGSFRRRTLEVRHTGSTPLNITALEI